MTVKYCCITLVLCTLLFSFGAQEATLIADGAELSIGS